MKKPTLTPVKSSNIDAIGFGNDGLFVRFKGGSLYRYPAAPKSLYENMLKAESVGSFFASNIRGTYHHLPVDD